MANLTLRQVKGSLLSIQEMDDNLTGINNDAVGAHQRLNTLATTSVTEGTNLYYTNARVYSNVTQIGFTVPADLTTANVSEDTNLYFTNTRAVSALSSGVGIDISANGLITGVASISTTDDLPEGANLYFTNTRAVSALTAGTGIVVEANGRVFSTVSGDVVSVNGETGAVVLTTSNIAESGSNVYYSNARVLGYTAVAFNDIFNRANVNSEQAVIRHNISFPANTHIEVDTYGSQVNPDISVTAGEGISFNLTFSHAMFYRRPDGTDFNSGIVHVEFDTGNITFNSDANGKVGGVTFFKAPVAEAGNTIFFVADEDANLKCNINIVHPTLLNANVTFNNVIAQNFITSGSVTGTPTIESDTNINLTANGSAGGAVVVTNSPFRVRSYTFAEITALTPTAGDIVFNTSNTKFQGYNGTSWVDFH